MAVLVLSVAGWTGGVSAEQDAGGADELSAGWKQWLGGPDLSDMNVRETVVQGLHRYALADLDDSDGHDDVIVLSRFSDRVKARVPLEGAPQGMTYVGSHGAVYLTYRDAELSEPVGVTRIVFDSETPPQEEPILTSTISDPDTYYISFCGVEPAGEYLAICVSDGSFWFSDRSLFMIDADANVADRVSIAQLEHLTYVPANNALYYLVTEHGHRLAYRTLGADGTVADNPVYSDPLTSGSVTFAVSESGDMLAKSYGPLLDPETLEPLTDYEQPTWASLPGTNVRLIQWVGEDRLFALTDEWDRENRRLWFTDVRRSGNASNQEPNALDVNVDGPIDAIYPWGRHAVVVGTDDDGEKRVDFVREPRFEAPKFYCPSRARSGSPFWIAYMTHSVGTPPPDFEPTTDTGPGNGYSKPDLQIGGLLIGPAPPDSYIRLFPGSAAGEPGPLYWGVWLDKDRDGRFDDGEQVYEGRHTGPVTFPISASDANTGKTRLRIVVTDDEVPQPCGFYENGETEDYTITVEWL